MKLKIGRRHVIEVDNNGYLESASRAYVAIARRDVEESNGELRASDYPDGKIAGYTISWNGSVWDSSGNCAYRP